MFFGTIKVFRPAIVVSAAIVLAVAVLSTPAMGAMPKISGTTYAVLYAGGYAWRSCSGTYYYVYRNDLKFAFNTLVNDYGYSKDNIFVLYHNGASIDLDGDGENDIDYSATKSNLSTVFNMLDSNMSDRELLFFYATDHGFRRDEDSIYVYGLKTFDGNDITAEDLKDFFLGLDSENRSVEKMILITTCYSGNILNVLKESLEGHYCTIASACGPGESAHYCNTCDCVCGNKSFNSCHHNAFSFYWMGAMHGSSPDGSLDFSGADANSDGYVTAKEAFNFAKANSEYAVAHSEHPKFYDGHCYAPDRMTLGGPIPPYTGPKFIFTVNLCKDFFCELVPRLPRCSDFGSYPVGYYFYLSEAGQGSTIWIDPVPIPGDVTYVYARVWNAGDTEAGGAMVNFFVSDAGLSLILPGDEMTMIGSVELPTVMPGDTERRQAHHRLQHLRT